MNISPGTPVRRVLSDLKSYHGPVTMDSEMLRNILHELQVRRKLMSKRNNKK